MPRILPSKVVLLLGATGQIGGEIRKAFQREARGSQLICCSRQLAGERFPGETWMQLDPLADQWPETGHVDVVINAVGAIQATQEMPFDRVHSGVTAQILAHRERLGHPRIVQISALGADPQHSSEFLGSKGIADALLLDQPSTIVLRPSIVCTPGTMLSQKMQKLLVISRFALGKMLVPKGFSGTRLQPILGQDLGDAVVHAALSPLKTGVIDLVGPEKISFGELIQTMAKAQGRNVRLVEVSREIMETFVAHFVGVWFPGLINLEQFRLLFEDNVGEVEGTITLLGRMPAPTLDFWRTEVTERDEPTMIPDEKSSQKSLFLREVSSPTS